MSSDRQLAKVDVQVNTLAQPGAKSLLDARLWVQRDEFLRHLFQRSREEKWGAQNLADEISVPLAERMHTTVEAVADVARYLADEYVQIGDSMLVINPETGRAIARIDDEDMYTPAPVPREDGTLEQMPPRLRPELEGFLITWQFDKAREDRLVQTALAKRQQTDLLREAGDWRLLPLTRDGRKKLAEGVGATLNDVLPNGCQGQPRKFIDKFNIIRDGQPPTGGVIGKEQLVGLTVLTQISMGIQDGLALNLNFDVGGSIRASIANAWTREVFKTISGLAHVHHEPPPVVPLEQLRLLGTELIIADAETANALAPKIGMSQVLVVEGASLCAITAYLGVLIVRETECRSRELHGRWEVAARMTYDLWINWRSVRPLAVSGLPVVEHQAEIVTH